MFIWQKNIDLDTLRRSGENCSLAYLGIEIVEIGEDFLCGRMPVDYRTKQPFGLLHGGASVFLAETLGSTAAYYACAEGVQVVGLDVNANHLRAVTSGWVSGIARPIHLGRSTHVWQIDISDDAGELVCVSRLTMVLLSQITH